eukprot:m.327748 g.327748  ORF g.327748 m.327748 type:complete len:180 (+) comp16496_c0_seq9:463-1002(+)
MAGKVRVFLAMSLDGYIAGPNNELDWLHPGEGAEDTFTPFFASIGAMLMGKTTHNIVAAMDSPWPYGEVPVFVATRSGLESPGAPTVRAVSGPIAELVDQAKAVAAKESKDVYLDGGALVRSGIDAGCVDELIITVIPIVLGAGVPLFSGVARRKLDLVSTRELGAGLVELKYTFKTEK